MLDALDALDAFDDSELVESMLTDDVVLLSSLRSIFCGDNCIDLVFGALWALTLYWRLW